MIKDLDLNKEKKILDWLEANIGFENFKHALERSLDRLKNLINNSELDPSLKIITVGGTNGKGETCLNITRILKYNKKRYSFFSSPHVFSIRERFQNEKGLISYDDLEKYLNIGFQNIQEKNVELSFFEFLFYVFFLWSQSQKIDFMVLEVGLGGRLDATNLLDTDLAVITSIGRDHQEYLGNKLKDILNEKIQISRPKKYLITNFKLNYLSHLSREYCLKKNVNYLNLKQVHTDDFHEKNWKLSKEVGKHFNLESIDAVKSKRNFSYEYKSLKFLFYGAHNPAGMRAMLNSFCRAMIVFDCIVLSFSKRPIGDIETMVNTLLAYTAKKCRIFITDNNNFKSFPLEEMKDIFNGETLRSIEFISDWDKIISEINKQPGAQVLVSGSYYFISPFYLFLNNLDSERSSL